MGWLGRWLGVRASCFVLGTAAFVVGCGGSTGGTVDVLQDLAVGDLGWDGAGTDGKADLAGDLGDVGGADVVRADGQGDVELVADVLVGDGGGDVGLGDLTDAVDQVEPSDAADLLDDGLHDALELDSADDAEDIAELTDLDAPDSIPAVVWDNSIYTPAGEPFPIVGFGAGTVGGFQEGHDVYHVTSLADSGPGSLREGLYSNNVPRVVVFDLDGTIVLQGAVLVPSNITIDGRGRKIVIQGKGFVIPGSDQVILINLALEDVVPDSEDGLQIGSALPDPSENIVIDHVRFTQHGDNGNAKNTDEAISIVFGSRNITIAWCRFEAWEKVLLAGNGDADAALDSQITLTWHHSYAYNTGRRHPQARYGHFHLFNNFWDDWYMYGLAILSPYPESFGSQIQDNGRMLLEGQLVRRHVHALYDWSSTANDASRCESGGDLLEYNTWVVPDSTAPLKFGVGCAKQQAFTPPYEVDAETPGQQVMDRILLYSGNTL